MGRRATGGVTPHGKGIQLTLYWRGKRLRPTLALAPTPPNLRYAHRLVEEIRGKIRHGTFDYAAYFPDAKNAPAHGPAPQTFEEVGRAWLASLTEAAYTTRESYRRTLEAVWFEAIGQKPIKAIRYSDIQAVLGELPGSAKTRNNTLIPLRQTLGFALRDRQIEADPSVGIRNAKVQKEPPDPLTLAEVDKVLAKLANGQVRNWFEFAVFTGLRPSEQVSLQWTDIDFDARTARVSKARPWGKDKGTTKTHSVRDVELGERAWSALQRQEALTRLAGGAIFINPNTGRPWNDEQVQRRYWNAALKLAGMRHREQYQTRHTFATLALMAGANPSWISRQLGHASAQMLYRVYSKWIDRADQGRELAKLDTATRTATKVPRGARRTE